MAPEDRFVVGKPVGQGGSRDKQSVECVCGTIECADDVFMGNKLHAAGKMSPHAHARVVSIDASKALAMDGVEDVIGPEDHPQWSDVLLYVGQPFCAVAATTLNKARAALEQIEVEYEIRPAAITPDEAKANNAPLVGIWPEGNTNVRTTIDRGDLDAGFAEADVVTETHTGWSCRHQHSMIEGGNTTAWWNGDECYAWVSTQNPHSEHRGLAGAFALKQNQVHVYTHGNGGGFGSGRYATQATAALLAKRTGRVVSYHSDRIENFHSGQQFATRADVRIGAKLDGTLTAIEYLYESDQGANSRAPMTGTHNVPQSGFRCANARFQALGIATNTPPCWYYRCVAHPGGSFTWNMALDEMATELGMDPYELRMKNWVTIDDDSPDESSPRPFSHATLTEIGPRVAEAIDYDAKKHAPGQNNVLPDGRLHGIAITGHMDHHGGISSGRAAIVHLRGDGTGFINAGISRTGGGTNTGHCHIVAERLGMASCDDINVGDYGNTGVTADGGMQAGSTNSTSTGASFYVAASDAREQMLAQAATMFDPVVNPEDLDAAQGKIFQIADPTKSLTIAEVCGRASRIIGHASANWGSVLTRPVRNYEIGDNARQRVPCATGAEVAVDTETGEVEILKIAYCTDIGQIFFYDGAMGQAQAGIDHVIAQAMYWDQTYDKATGRSLTADYLTHRFPTSLDLPIEKYSAMIHEGDSAVGPYGGTGMGEPCSGNHSAVNQAVYNAIGAPVMDGPLQPWHVLKALGKV
jgi:xanthine dehydrogenase molybdenum-binding subunit